MASSVLRLRLWATAALAVTGLILMSLAVFLFNGPAVRWGLLVAFVFAVPSYWSLSLTLRLSNNAFLGAFVGGMLGRLLGLAVAVGVVWRFDRDGVFPFALAAVAGLIVFSFIELFFIGRQNRL